MKLRSVIAIMLFGLAAGVWAQAPADNNRIKVATTLDYSSKYIFRGIPQTDEPVLQPGIDLVIPKVGLGQLAIGWWGNLNLTDGAGRSKENEFTEYDWSLAYGLALNEMVNLEVGTIYYYFPHGGKDFTPMNGLGNNHDSDTHEFYGQATLTLAAGFQAVATGYYDGDEVKSWYVSSGVNHHAKLTDTWSSTLSAQVAWAPENYNKAYFGYESGGFNDVLLGASLDAAIDKNFRLKIGVAYSEIIDTDLERAVDNMPGAHSNNFWFKVGLHGSF